MKNASNQKTESVPDRPMNRRKFFLTVGNSIIGIIGAGAAMVLYRFVSPEALKEIPPRFKVGSPDLLQPSSFIFNEEYHVYVVRGDQGDFYAISSICTHLGCSVNWRPVSVPGNPKGIISCPCHGSVYDKYGNVLSGPAPRHLDRFAITLENNLLVVNTDKIVPENEMFLKI